MDEFQYQWKPEGTETNETPEGERSFTAFQLHIPIHSIKFIALSQTPFFILCNANWNCSKFGKQAPKPICRLPVALKSHHHVKISAKSNRMANEICEVRSVCSPLPFSPISITLVDCNFPACTGICNIIGAALTRVCIQHRVQIYTIIAKYTESRWCLCALQILIRAGFYHAAMEN